MAMFGRTYLEICLVISVLVVVAVLVYLIKTKRLSTYTAMLRRKRPAIPTATVTVPGSEENPTVSVQTPILTAASTRTTHRSDSGTYVHPGVGAPAGSKKLFKVRKNGQHTYRLMHTDKYGQPLRDSVTVNQ
jgi:hypothetical protein